MGFSEAAISKIISTIPSQGVSAPFTLDEVKNDASPRVSSGSSGPRDFNAEEVPTLKLIDRHRDQSESTLSMDETNNEMEVPLVCRIPGVQGGSLCEPYLNDKKGVGTESSAHWTSEQTTLYEKLENMKNANPSKVLTNTISNFVKKLSTADTSSSGHMAVPGRYIFFDIINTVLPWWSIHF